MSSHAEQRENNPSASGEETFQVKFDASPFSTPAKENSQDRKDLAENSDHPAKFKPSPRFWAIISTLCVIGLLSALENTVVTTSLPFIVTELDLGENYIWVTNIFFLTRSGLSYLVFVSFA